MTAEVQVYSPLDAAIDDWIKAKFGRSNSQRTEKTYRETIAEFRAVLKRERGADLLADPALVALVAEQWAGSSRRDRVVSASTFNQRLAIISSFYVYYAKKAILSGRPVINPIQAVDRRKVQAYAAAMPLDAKDMGARLKAIDRSTLQGKRDYALLTVLAVTGRRLAEVAAMKRSDLTFGDRIVIRFPRCKGNKSMSDTLTPKQSRELLDWLQACYGRDLGSLPHDAPIWISLSRQNKGQPLGTQAIADVCQKYLGTSKVHTLRHTFAVLMEKAGAPISEIQNRLGHENSATTGIYLKQLHAAENPYAGRLDDLLGIGD